MVNFPEAEVSAKVFVFSLGHKVYTFPLMTVLSQNAPVDTGIIGYSNLPK